MNESDQASGVGESPDLCGSPSTPSEALLAIAAAIADELEELRRRGATTYSIKRDLRISNGQYQSLADRSTSLRPGEHLDRVAANLGLAFRVELVRLPPVPQEDQE